MTTRRLPIHRLRHRGFNFAEVLFAVMILGVGFIMVAAMFPVAIQQSRTSTNETVAARVAESALQVVRANATDTTLPQTGNPAVVNSLNGALASALMSDLIYSIDPRFGWTVLHSRTNGSNHAQVFVVVMQVQNRQSYTADDLRNTSTPNYNPSTFEPHAVFVHTAEGDLGPDMVRFTDDTGSPIEVAAAAEGAVLIIRDDFREDDSATDFLETRGQLNGRVYRLGRKRADQGTGVWEMMPGHDMAYYAGGSGAADDIHENIPGPDPAHAWLIGRGHDNVGSGDPANFEGTNQAIAVYQAVVPIRP